MSTTSLKRHCEQDIASEEMPKRKKKKHHKKQQKGNDNDKMTTDSLSIANMHLKDLERIEHEVVNRGNDHWKDLEQIKREVVNEGSTQTEDEDFTITSVVNSTQGDARVSDSESRQKKKKKKKHKHASDKETESSASVSFDSEGLSTQENIVDNMSTNSAVFPHAAYTPVSNNESEINNMHSPTDSSSISSKRKKKEKRVQPRKSARALQHDTDSNLHLLHDVYGCEERKIEKLKREMKAHGIQVKTGKWSQEEEEKLRKNWEQFSKKYEIYSISELLFTTGLEKDKAVQIKDFIKDTEFYKCLAHGISRPTYNVRLRARRLLTVETRKGRLSEEEDKQLTHLQGVHGNNWVKIGQLMELSPSIVCERWRVLSSERKGRWTDEELECLTKAVKAVQSGDETKGLPWAAIADLVPGRSDRQCRDRWILYQNKPAFSWTIEHDINLLKCVYELNVTCENDIDWQDLMPDFEGVPSHQLIAKHFHILKRKVPAYYIKPFEETIEYLHSKILPRLEQGLYD